MQDKVIVLAVGSFNPPTFGHLRMLEDAKVYLEKMGKTVLGGIMSPVADAYGKSTLISAAHRVNMTIAATSDSDWIKVSDWEATQKQWTPTLELLKYHDKLSKETHGKDVDVVLLVGGDVVDTFPMFKSDGIPVWQMEDLVELVKMGLVVQPRDGSDPKKTIASFQELKHLADKVLIIEGTLGLNTSSSSSLRAAIAENHSIKYTTSDSVIDYIKEHQLYK